jgi:hypothetical protein
MTAGVLRYLRFEVFQMLAHLLQGAVIVSHRGESERLVLMHRLQQHEHVGEHACVDKRAG